LAAVLAERSKVPKLDERHSRRIVERERQIARSSRQ